MIDPTIQAERPKSALEKVTRKSVRGLKNTDRTSLYPPPSVRQFNSETGKFEPVPAKSDFSGDTEPNK